MSQDLLNEKTEQSAPLLSPTDEEVLQESNDTESTYGEEMVVETSSGLALNPAFYIA